MLTPFSTGIASAVSMRFCYKRQESIYESVWNARVFDESGLKQSKNTAG
jgi:hypothetical protein